MAHLGSWAKDAALIRGVVRLGTGGGTLVLVVGSTCVMMVPEVSGPVRFSGTSVLFDV